MSRTLSLRLAFLAAFATSLAALPAAADLAPWDQGRATGIAKQLVDACDAFEQAVRKQPGIDQLGAGSAGEGFGIKQNSRMLTEHSRALAGHLEKGKGHDDTKNEWRSLKEVADDVAEGAQRSELDEPTMDAWAKVTDLMRQLAPYYDPKALTP
jgi:hypothetical protein